MWSLSERGSVRVARTFLFVPGDRPERFDKARASGADALILDLEDAVAGESKARAREAVATWLAGQGQAIVRINAADTEWFEDDLRMIQTSADAGVMLAKAEPDSLTRASSALPGRIVIALLETVAGYMSLRQLAGVPGVERIAFGSIDFAVDSGIADEADAMTSIRTQIVLESRHAGLSAPIDGVSLELTDDRRILADALRSRQLGFGGKLCIHPRQIEPVGAAFRPTPEQLEWAHRVLAAFAASRGAATALDGKMIDKPVVERARRIVSEK
jgi:citrate lyase subunit beta / citryl-CoA lyase